MVNAISKERLLERIEEAFRDWEKEANVALWYYKQGITLGFISGAYLTGGLTSEEYEIYSGRIERMGKK